MLDCNTVEGEGGDDGGEALDQAEGERLRLRARGGDVACEGEGDEGGEGEWVIEDGGDFEREA